MTVRRDALPAFPRPPNGEQTRSRSLLFRFQNLFFLAPSKQE